VAHHGESLYVKGISKLYYVVRPIQKRAARLEI
jgi:hypothetical protein